MKHKLTHKALIILFVIFVFFAVVAVILAIRNGNASSNSGQKDNDGFTYKEVDGEMVITGFQGDSSDLIIPKTIQNKSVTRIEASSLGDKVTSITIPDSVKVIQIDQIDASTAILGVPGSEAEKYASEKGMPFEKVDGSIYADSSNQDGTDTGNTEYENEQDTISLDEPTDEDSGVTTARSANDQDSTSENKSDSEATTENDAASDDGCMIIVDTIEASAGDKGVKVKASIKNNPGILGAVFSVYYDEDALTLTGVTSESAFSPALTFTKANVLKSGCNLVWDGMEISEENIKDGTIVSFDFDIEDGAEPGNYQVVLSYTNGDVIDKDLRPISIEIKNGSINVE